MSYNSITRQLKAIVLSHIPIILMDFKGIIKKKLMIPLGYILQLLLTKIIKIS